MLKLRNLRAVETVADAGSVSQAARLLNLSQPAVTHAIKRIEKQLQVTLFERRHNGMVITKIGAIVNERIKLALLQLDLAEREIKSLPAQNLEGKKSQVSIQKIVNYTHLSTLVEVSNYKSIPYAAQQIGVTEPVVYRSLRELEDIVGANLFHRGTDFTTTVVGEVLVRRAKLIFAELRHMDDDIQQYNGRMAGSIVVGTLPSSRTILVPRAIAQLSEQYPDLQFSMIDEPYDDMLSRLRCGDIDVIVGSVRNPSHFPDVIEETLFLEPVSILAKSNHPLVSKGHASTADLCKFGWVVPRKGTPTREYFETLFRNFDLEPPTDFVETDSLIATRSLLIENNRLTLISPNRAYFELQVGLLDVVPFDTSEMAFSFGYTIRKQAALSPGISEFIRKLHELGRDEISRWHKADTNVTPIRKNIATA